MVTCLNFEQSFFVAALRTSLAGLQPTVTALQYTLQSPHRSTPDLKKHVAQFSNVDTKSHTELILFGSKREEVIMNCKQPTRVLLYYHREPAIELTYS